MGIDPSLRHLEGLPGVPFGVTTYLYDEAVFGFAHSNPDSAGLLSAGARTFATLYGHPAGQPNDTVQVSFSEVTKVSAGRYASRSNFSSIGSTTQDLIVRFSSGSTINLNVPNNTLITSTDWPSLMHAAGSTTRTGLRFEDSTTVIVNGTVYGSVGSVDIVARGGTAITSLTRQDLMAQNMSSILYISAFMPPAVPGLSSVFMGVLAAMLLLAAVALLHFRPQDRLPGQSGIA